MEETKVKKNFHERLQLSLLSTADTIHNLAYTTDTLNLREQ